MKLLLGVASGEDGNLNRERGKGKSLQVELEFIPNSVTGVGERNGTKVEGEEIAEEINLEKRH
jgi:hypothetical protein